MDVVLNDIIVDLVIVYVEKGIERKDRRQSEVRMF